MCPLNACARALRMLIIIIWETFSYNFVYALPIVQYVFCERMHETHTCSTFSFDNVKLFSLDLILNRLYEQFTAKDEAIVFYVLLIIFCFELAICLSHFGLLCCVSSLEW